MNRTVAAALSVLLAAVSARTEETLVRKIDEKAESVRELGELYEERTERSERRAILERILTETAWLEQIGGLKSARSDALLALARWELLELQGAPSCGFLGDDAGIARPSLLVRAPGRDDLPDAFGRYKNRILFIQLHNESAQPVLLGRPVLEVPGALGESKSSDLSGVDAWPEDLKALAKWGKWPERLDGQTKATILVWLLPGQTGALGLSVPVRWSEEDQPPRQLRAVFLKESFPEDFARAQRAAAKREKEANRKPADPAVARGQTPDKPETGTPASKAPAEQVPPLLGRVTASGGGHFIQVRLDETDTYQPGRQLRVRKNDRWVGVVRLDATSATNKKTVRATILQGEWDSLVGGSLHDKP